MNFCASILFVFLLTCFSPDISRAEQPAKIPSPLTPWVEWVLHGHEAELLCPPSFNDSSVLHCDWPSQLDLKVTEPAGSFRQQWLVQYERWLQLPGDTEHWPIDVKVNGQAALVMNREGLPKIRVKSGAYEITGRFQWSALPEYVTIPPHTGLVSLAVNERPIDFPNLDRNSRLWLQTSRTQTEKIENSLNLQTFRLLDDTIPAQMVTLLKLDIAGAAREMVLGPVFAPEQTIPLALNSDLPARLEQDGRIRVQVRPGQWTIKLITRQIGPLATYRWTRPDDPFWTTEEILSFQAHPDLRTVEITGLAALDPTQTSMPEEWRSFPAYRLPAGETMQLKETRRGAAQPSPDQLSLQRELWLRFDGSGYTIQDKISGQKNNDWRLEMTPPLELGRVVVNNREQFITKKAGSSKAGIEVREGQLQLTADSSYPHQISTISTLPATGWDHDFQKVQATLHLPPGWKLLNATGIDSIANTWIARWTLLDFFLVIIFTLAVARLYARPPLTIIAFLSYTLSYHESGAPRWVWLAILVGVALLRYLPAGKFRQIIKGYQAITILMLIIIVVPFTINQLRVGIYPQLEKPWQSMSAFTERRQEPQAVAPAPAPAEKALARNAAVMDSAADKMSQLAEIATGGVAPTTKLKGSLAMPVASLPYQSQVPQYDPKMIQQTGPGLPTWQWNQVAMSWSGPVQRDQQISFTLIGPKINLVLAFTRILLMALLALGMLNITYRRGQGWALPAWKSSFLLPLLFLLSGFLAVPAPCQADEIPSPEMFEQLRARLLEKADCFPDCAAITDMTVTLSPETLGVTMHVDSQIDGAVPLPGNGDHWLPQQIRIDNKPASGLLRSEKQLWILVPGGRHQIQMQGKIPQQNTLQLPLPLHPHHIVTDTQGWIVEGINKGIADNQLQFKRIVDKQDNATQVLDTGILPPFVLIDRTLLLGLTWKVETRISRTTPKGSAIILNIPLLPGESIVTEGIRVQDGQANVNLDAESSELRWESVLEKSDQLILKHADTDQWTEIWRVDVSPIYHMETAGIPVILHQQGSRWYPTWHPWPGDEVKLLISRPEGIAGQTLTIDKSTLQVRPGGRATESKLNLSIRSSQGGQHTITLPAAAQLQRVTINGTVQQVRQDGAKISLPITPGKQEVALEWREPSGLGIFYTTPRIDLGAGSVNAAIDVTLPPNRWPLFLGGPLLGPALLYWSVLLVVALVAFALSKTNLTPLRFYQLFLLGIGMSMSNLFGCLLVVGWLIALHFRKIIRPDRGRSAFNLIQTGLGALTVLALVALVRAISQGLLGHPDMNIIGNGSNGTILRWYQDISSQHLPQAWLVSIPMLAYRLAMLAWALWISFTLLGLLKWGWNIVSEPMLWDSTPKKKAEDKKEKITS
ncbi:MAG: hypothetical protein NTY00_03370 [Deltaproteobacteria bacterium]|nr:hypothetical protein [Deltaproteobacteria bacterium]